MSGPSVESYLDGLGEGPGPLAKAAHDLLIAAGCTSYVKTIYIGYDVGGEMVAALYGHNDRIEIALALPDDADHPLLIDASHLTWRSLPVAALVRTEPDLISLAELIAVACHRIQTKQHDVMRDAEFFIRRRKNVRGTKPSVR